MQPSVYEHFNNICLHIGHMQSLCSTGCAKLLLTRRLATVNTKRTGRAIGWLSIKHKQIYFGVSFVKQTIKKRRKHCTCNNKRTMVCRAPASMIINTLNELTLLIKKVGGGSCPTCPPPPPPPSRLHGPCSVLPLTNIFIQSFSLHCLASRQMEKFVCIIKEYLSMHVKGCIYKFHYILLSCVLRLQSLRKQTQT